jgi:hypothetical protein
MYSVGWGTLTDGMTCNDAILAYALCILILFGLRQLFYNEEQDPDPDPYKKN